MADELKNGQVIQMYEKPLREDGTPGDDNTPQFPITVSGAVMHGNGTIDQELEKLKYLADFQKLAENLTDGQAVTAQVAENAVAIERLDEQKADTADTARKAGVYMQMIAGLAEGIWDTNPESGKSQEWLVGRPVLGVPDLTISPKKTTMDDRSGENKDIVVDKVAGGVIGGQQMAPSVLEGRFSNLVVKKEGNLFRITGTPNSSQVNISSTIQVNVNHKYFLTEMFHTNDANKPMRACDGYAPSASLARNFASIYTKQTTSFIIQLLATTNVNYDATLEQPLLLDLTTLFPTDPDFVNSLGQNDASRVLTRLGIIAIDVA